MYNVGDKILYPMYGAGTIQAIEERKILKDKQSFYIVQISVGNMVVMIPTANTEQAGIRNVISRERALEVIEKFKNDIADANSNWNQRYRENMEKLKNGDVEQVLDVVKSLMLRDVQNGLSSGERKMLSNAKNILISELVLAEADTPEHIESLLEQAINAKAG